MTPAVERESLEDRPAERGLCDRTSSVLSEGGLVALPTETVYGIAARADRPEAVAALQELKGRPEKQPLTWHVGGTDALKSFPARSPLAPLIGRLTDRYWPGPLTLVLEGVPAGLEGIASDGWCGVRCPAHEGTRTILGAIDFPVVMTSANLHGEPALTDADAVVARFGDALALVLDGGPSPLAEASSVLRIGRGHFELLREGLLGIDQLRAAAGLKIGFTCTGNTCRSPMAEGIARYLLAERLGIAEDELASFGFEVHSSGVFASNGLPPSAFAVVAASELGADIASHASHTALSEEIARLDRVYCMTRPHQEALVQSLPPGKAEHVELLDPEGTDVPDPIGGTQDDYRRCAGRIRELIEARLDEWA